MPLSLSEASALIVREKSKGDNVQPCLAHRSVALQLFSSRHHSCCLVTASVKIIISRSTVYGRNLFHSYSVSVIHWAATAADTHRERERERVCVCMHVCVWVCTRACACACSRWFALSLKGIPQSTAMPQYILGAEPAGFSGWAGCYGQRRQKWDYINEPLWSLQKLHSSLALFLQCRQLQSGVLNPLSSFH